jgi:hypothetical protein
MKSLALTVDVMDVVLVEQFQCVLAVFVGHVVLAVEVAWEAKLI